MDQRIRRFVFERLAPLVSSYHGLSFMGMGLSGLIESAQSGDNPAREEAYERLFRALDYQVQVFLKQHPYLDESECYYAGYQATEFAIAHYRKEKGEFLAFWGSLVLRGLELSLKRWWKSEARRKRLEMALAMGEVWDGGFHRPWAEAHYDSALAYRKVQEKLTRPAVLSLYLLGYSGKETGALLHEREKAIRSALRTAKRQAKSVLSAGFR